MKIEASMLQSEPWARFQRALGKEVLQVSGEGFHGLGIVETSPLGNSLYVPYGPFAADEAALGRALEALKSEATARGLSYVRVEPISTDLGTAPDRTLTRLGLTPAPHDVQPRDTLIIDVTRDEKAILADMRSSNRNIARNIHKKGVRVRTSQDPADLSILTGLLEATAARGEFTAHTHDYLRTAAEVLMPEDAATLYIAELTAEDGRTEPIASAFTYDTPEVRVYAHAAASDAHRKLSPGVAVLVELIRDARARGQHAVDLWGIAPNDDPTHRWAGFTKFKRSFGGAEAHYPGSWDLPLDGKYRLYRAVRASRGLAAKAAARSKPALKQGLASAKTLAGKARRR